MTDALLETKLPGIPLVNQGKVRDIYDLGTYLLIVTTDRISAFDVIMNEGIPGKGEVLTRTSKFWFDQIGDIVDHHLVSTDVADFPASVQPFREQLEGRSMLVHKAQPLPIECIVRGYLSGSGWKEYQKSGTVCGIPLPAGLSESAQLEQPIFTPSTKAEIGAHDENISFEQACELCGNDVAEKVRSISIELYCRARDLAVEKGIIIADTKFEFGLKDGKILLIDEALTPDSSRFWPAAQYTPGQAQPSFDKQFLRDYLNTLDWDKQAPPPSLPDEIVQRTSEKYREAYDQLTS